MSDRYPKHVNICIIDVRSNVYIQDAITIQWRTVCSLEMTIGISSMEIYGMIPPAVLNQVK
jgi:hypothetical protein